MCPIHFWNSPIHLIQFQKIGDSLRDSIEKIVSFKFE